jgi:hypothetical protein
MWTRGERERRVRNGRTSTCWRKGGEYVFFEFGGKEEGSRYSTRGRKGGGEALVVEGEKIVLESGGEKIHST